MKTININKMTRIIKNVVATTPGIFAFVDTDVADDANKVGLEADVMPSLKIRKIKSNYYQIKIHIISSIYTNFLQVLQELQHKVKYELEKEMDLYNNFRVDICIQDLID